MSQFQGPGESAAAHDKSPTIGDKQGTSTAPSIAETGVPEFAQTLPPGLLEAELEQRKTKYTDKDKADAWQNTSEVVQRYSDEMVERWNKEIDAYLTFAGLFSAVLTAFNVESYKLLSPVAPDPTLLALQQISLQLSSFSAGSSPIFTINSTHPAYQLRDIPPPPIPRAEIWLNILWFSSLILSLSSATIGIIAKQWLNEYASGISSKSGNSRHTARLRQYRLNNLKKWHVGDIVNTIPVLLQVSVALFLAGLLVLLWTLHPTVAAVASVLAGLLGAFTLSTVILPSIKPGCAYLSPQSLALYDIFLRAPSLIKVSLKELLIPLTFYLLEHHQIMCLSTRKVANALWEWGPVKAPTWHGIEQSVVSKESESLDVNIICAAYDTAMNPHLLTTAAICLSELEPSIHVVNCIERLQKIDEIHFGVSPSPDVCAVVSATGPVIYHLWADSLLCCSVQAVQSITFSRGGTHPISDTEARLHPHFLHASRQLLLGPQGAVEGNLIALSIAACQVGQMLTDMPLLHRVLRSIRVILVQYNRAKVPFNNPHHVYITAHQQILTTPPLTIQHISQFCVYITATNIILESVAASQEDDHQTRILSYAHHGLRHLTSALQLADYPTLTNADQVWLYLFVEQLSALVNIATEEPAFPVDTLLPPDRMSALEHAVTAIQGAIRLCGQSEDDYWIRNRAGDKETLEDKLVRLREPARSGPRSAPPQEAMQSGAHALVPTHPSSPILFESPAVSRSSSYHSISPDERQASPRSLLDYSASDSPGPSL